MKRLTVFIQDEDKDRITTFLTQVTGEKNFGACVRKLIDKELKKHKQEKLTPVLRGVGRKKECLPQ
jgi:hypothetical protein